MIMRGKALRQAIIIRALAIERLFRRCDRLAAYAVWKFRGVRAPFRHSRPRPADLPRRGSRSTR